MRIRSPRDFWAGAIYLALAIAAIWIGQSYQLGTSERMGPGYFPTALGSILALFGVVSLGRSFVRQGEAISAIAWRPLALVLGSTVLFGLLLPRAGLLIALPCLIVVGALAAARYWRRLRLIRSKRSSRRRRKNSDKAPLKAWPVPRPPTMPGRRHHSFRC